MATSCKYEFQVKHLGFCDATAQDFYTSQWFKNKYIFLVYRIVLFVYCTFWSIYGGLILIKEFSRPYLFLSNWGEWTLALYFAWSLGVTLYGVISGSCIEAGEDNCGCSGNKLNRGDLRWYHHIQWILLSTYAGLAYIVTIIYWSFLSGIIPVNAGVNIHQHVMNTLLILLEIFINRIPIRFLHFIYVVIYAMIYVVFTLILHGTGVQSIYYPNILDWQNIPGLSAGVCLGLMFVGSPVVHTITFGVYHLRALIARKCKCGGSEWSDIENGNRDRGHDNNGFPMTATAE